MSIFRPGAVAGDSCARLSVSTSWQRIQEISYSSGSNVKLGRPTIMRKARAFDNKVCCQPWSVAWHSKLPAAEAWKRVQRLLYTDIICRYGIFYHIGAIFWINVGEYSYMEHIGMLFHVHSGFHGFPPLRPKIWFCQWESPSAAESHQPTA